MPKKINEPSAQLSFSLKLKASQGKKFKVVLRIATKHTVSVILLQDTHTTSNDNVKVYGFLLIGTIHHAKHGIAKLVKMI